MTGRKHRPNTELFGQGIANIISGFIGGLPATGAIARTATNIKAGAKTPVAGIIHALLLAIFAILAGPLIGLVPLAALAAVLMVVAWNMADPPHLIRMLLRAPNGDRIVTLVTLSLTVLADLTVAVQIGIVLAAVLFMHQMSSAVSLRSSAEDNPLLREALPEGVEVFEIDGPVFYGAVSRLQRALDQIANPARVFILRLEHASLIDATGAAAIDDLAHSLAGHNGTLILCGARPEVSKVLASLGLFAGQNVTTADDFAAALAFAETLLHPARPPKDSTTS
jgi:SulP family sulfate permease